jgi:hypothetical protein
MPRLLSSEHVTSSVVRAAMDKLIKRVLDRKLCAFHYSFHFRAILRDCVDKTVIFADFLGGSCGKSCPPTMDASFLSKSLTENVSIPKNWTFPRTGPYQESCRSQEKIEII